MKRSEFIRRTKAAIAHGISEKRCGILEEDEPEAENA